MEAREFWIAFFQDGKQAVYFLPRPKQRGVIEVVHVREVQSDNVDSNWDVDDEYLMDDLYSFKK